MTKLFFLLLTSITLWAHGQSVFYAGDTTYFPRISLLGDTVYRQAGYAVITPSSYTASKKYPVLLNIHGIGETGNGNLPWLRNVTLGFDYDGAGPEPRKYAIPTPDFLKAINQYQFIGVIPTYLSKTSGLSVSDINYILDQVEKDYSVDESREALMAFSLGGGAVVRYMTSSLANAQRVALVVAAAPVNWATNYTYVTAAGLPFIGVTNKEDERVSPINVQNIVRGIEGANPIIKPTLITFDHHGHGGINEIQQLYHPKVPQNIYEYLIAIDKDNPKQYPTTNSKPIPSDTVTPEPSKGLTAVAKDIGITANAAITLDGSASKGFAGASWGVISVPAGVNIYANLFPKGSGWHTVSASLPKEGAYTFVLNAYNSTATARDTIVVTYQKTSVPVPATPVNFDSSTGYLVFSDGSRIRATATIDWATKKVIVKGEDGISYSF